MSHDAIDNVCAYEMQKKMTLLRSRRAYDVLLNMQSHNNKREEELRRLADLPTLIKCCIHLQKRLSHERIDNECMCTEGLRSFICR